MFSKICEEYMLLENFFELNYEQFAYGGKKYAADNVRESTDILFDDFGFRFSLGTVGKYVKRFSNLKRERDMLKISCYSFIYWLKRGFHVQPNGTRNAIDTTVAIKEKYYPAFKQDVINFVLENNQLVKENRTERIYDLLKYNAEEGRKWNELAKRDLLEIFTLAYLQWKEDFGNNPGQDTDVHLKTDNK